VVLSRTSGDSSRGDQDRDRLRVGRQVVEGEDGLGADLAVGVLGGGEDGVEGRVAVLAELANGLGGGCAVGRRGVRELLDPRTASTVTAGAACRPALMRRHAARLIVLALVSCCLAADKIRSTFSWPLRTAALTPATNFFTNSCWKHRLNHGPGNMLGSKELMNSRREQGRPFPCRLL
jgi:hypothetical protein